MSKEGLLCVLSGFSGSGKGTVVKELTSRYDRYVVSVSATTRSPRKGEKEGISYFYKTEEEFKKLIAENAFYEYNYYQGHYYGTLHSYVDQLRREGKDVICEVDVNGAMHIRQQFPDTVLVFVTPPTAPILQQRLLNRHSEKKEGINGRLAQAVTESGYMNRYDYVMVNDRLEDCVEDLHHILMAEHLRAKRSEKFISFIQKDLKALPPL